jgi:predicted DNA-binding ribbon-helix-helix protein
MRSRIKKVSVILYGRRTSISIEKPFWLAFKEIAAEREMTLEVLLGVVDMARRAGRYANLSSAVRMFVWDTMREKFTMVEIAYRGAISPSLQPAMPSS